MKMSTLLKRDVPIYIAFLVAFILIIEYYVNLGTGFGDFLRKWAVDIVAWTSILAIISATRTHVLRISRRRTDWQLSAWLIILLWGMTILGFALGSNHEYFLFLTSNVMIATYAGIMGSVGFFILPSAYRAFRARNLEATIMLVVGIIIILGNVTVGEVIYPGITNLRSWLLDVPVAASQRGIMIAAAIGFIGILARAVLGVETNWLGRDDDEQ
jgi:hypothetical protein